MRALTIGGVGHILFAAFHLSFPVIFGWDETLGALSNGNRAVVYTLHLAEVVFFRMGVDGSWVGVLIFGAIGLLYLIPLLLIKPTQVATQ